MSLEHGKKRNKNEIKFIKKNTLVLSLCGLLGCALSASAAIPEPSAYGWAASTLMLVCGGLGSMRKCRKTNAA